VTPETPTHNSIHNSMVNRLMHPHRGLEFAPRDPCLIAVFLRVQIEHRLNLRVTRDSLHDLGFDLRLVPKDPPSAKQSQVIDSVHDPFLDEPCQRLIGVEKDPPRPHVQMVSGFTVSANQERASVRTFF